jgi:hypothetical protein
MIKPRRMMWAGYVALVEEMRNVYKVLVENPEGKTPLGRLSRRSEDNIKMDSNKIGWGVDSINLANDRTVGVLL